MFLGTALCISDVLDTPTKQNYLSLFVALMCCPMNYDPGYLEAFF